MRRTESCRTSDGCLANKNHFTVIQNGKVIFVLSAVDKLSRLKIMYYLLNVRKNFFAPFFLYSILRAKTAIGNKLLQKKFKKIYKALEMQNEMIYNNIKVVKSGVKCT